MKLNLALPSQKTKIEILLIALTISQVFVSIFLTTNRIGATKIFYQTTTLSILALALFYLIKMKDNRAIAFQVVLMTGICSTPLSLIFIGIWPLMYIINLCVLSFAIVCPFLYEFKSKKAVEKTILGISLLFMIVFAISHFLVIDWFNWCIKSAYAIIFSISLYMIIRKNKHFPFDNFLKTFVVYLLVNFIPHISFFAKTFEMK